MEEVCPICLTSVANGLNLVQCVHGHPMHARCALEMRRAMGREECPVCLGRLVGMMDEGLTSVVAWLVVLEHAVHVVLAYVWLLFVWMHLLGGSIVGEDARLQARLARSTLKARQGLIDSRQADLQTLRMHSVMVLLYVHGTAMFVGLGYLRASILCMADVFDAILQIVVPHLCKACGNCGMA